MNEITLDGFKPLTEREVEIIEDTEDYIIKRLKDGSYRKEIKYKKYASQIPESKEEQIELYKVLNNDSEKVVELRNMIGKKINIEQVFTNPYQSFDEETGENINGVSIIMKDNENYYATSSKSVYFNLFNMFEVFGYPNTGKYDYITVEVVGTRRQNGIQISLSLIDVN